MRGKFFSNLPGNQNTPFKYCPYKCDNTSIRTAMLMNTNFMAEGGGRVVGSVWALSPANTQWVLALPR